MPVAFLAAANGGRGAMVVPWKTHKHTSQEVVWQGQESEPVADMIIQLPRL